MPKLSYYISPYVYNILSNIVKKIKYIFNDKIKIGRFKIFKPPGYVLESFKRNWKFYDNFLPFLVTEINQNGIIIDVGANIGDTLFSVIDNCQNYIFCFEASNYYFNYLKKNLNLLDLDKKNRVEIFQYYIGSGKLTGELINKYGSTASLDLSKNYRPNFHQLDNLFSNYSKKVSLIKVDTDGFDYDVINSGFKLIVKDKPIIYFELFILNQDSVNNYIKLFDSLFLIGYKSIYLFDNFGVLFCKTNNFDILKDYCDYILIQNLNSLNKTINYFDILISHVDNNIDYIVNNYKKSYFNE